MIVPSGKYKGKSHTELLADTGYCQWILNNLTSDTTLHKFLSYCIKNKNANACWICLPNIPKNRTNTHEPIIDDEHPTCKKEFLRRRILLHREMKVPYAMDYVFSDEDEQG